MTLTANGNTIGTLRKPLEQSGGMHVKEPDSPGDTLLQPYKTGVTAPRFTLDVNVVSSDYDGIVATLEGLCTDEPCVYLADDGVSLYNDVAACWVVIPVWTAKLEYAGTTQVGTIHLECVVTTDSTGATYTPPG